MYITKQKGVEAPCVCRATSKVPQQGPAACSLGRGDSAGGALFRYRAMRAQDTYISTIALEQLAGSSPFAVRRATPSAAPSRLQLGTQWTQAASQDPHNIEASSHCADSPSAAAVTMATPLLITCIVWAPCMKVHSCCASDGPVPCAECSAMTQSADQASASSSSSCWAWLRS